MIEERLPLSFLFHSTTLLQERNRASLGHRATASAMVRETLFQSFRTTAGEFRNLSTSFYKRSYVFDGKVNVSYASSLVSGMELRQAAAGSGMSLYFTGKAN
jgi:hypothetical protein